MFVQDGELTADYYTVCYLKVADAAQYDNVTVMNHQTAVDTVADRLDAISKEHCVARRAQLIEDATAQLDDAKQTYSEQKAEAERQFAQAEQKLTDAQRSWMPPRPSWTQAKPSLLPRRPPCPIPCRAVPPRW